MNANYDNQMEVSRKIHKATGRKVYFDSFDLVDELTSKTIHENALDGNFSVESLIELVKNFNEYTIDDLFFSVNDIYSQFDEGEIPYENARDILIRCCKSFIINNERK